MPGREARHLPFSPSPTGSLVPMETPPPDPHKLLDHWMEWERGETGPGDLMKQLKMGGMRQILETLVEGGDPATGQTVGDLLDS